MSAFQSTDVSPAAVSQQASAVSSLVSNNPDQLSPTAKLNAAAFLGQLASLVSPSDPASASLLLASLGSISSAASTSVAGHSSRRLFTSDTKVKRGRELQVAVAVCCE